jgi:hypothetical protein
LHELESDSIDDKELELTELLQLFSPENEFFLKYIEESFKELSILSSILLLLLFLR